MSKIAIIGEGETVVVFKAFGFETFPCSARDEVERSLGEIKSRDFLIVYITEPVAKMVVDLIEELRKELRPLVCLIPDHRGSLGLGLEGVRKSAIKAMGTARVFGEAK